MAKEKKKWLLAWLWFWLALIGMAVAWPLRVVFETMEDFASIVLFFFKKISTVFWVFELWLNKFTSPWRINNELDGVQQTNDVQSEKTM